MTVSVKRNKVQYTGDNSTTAFSVTFPYTETSQVKVYLDSTLQTITTHYTLTDPGATGTVTFLTPPGTGVNVSLIRETDYLQGVDYVNNDALDAETLEKAFDKLTMMAQQLDLKVVAEGIESRAELDYLLARNCDYYQGYYFSRPMPPELFTG